jgi:geranylgeranyl diphosphate synthase type II
MSFKINYNLYLDQVESWLKENIKPQEAVEEPLYEAMNYSLLAGGKRMRPVLSLAVCDMLGGKVQTVLPFACAIELIHTYSLIHDDLPCMDNDDLRRGKPTNHKVYGDAMAVLAGDGLLNLAFEIMLGEVSKDQQNCISRAKAAYMISRAAGTSGMILGQVMDMNYEKYSALPDMLTLMHRKKTGALIRASVMSVTELLGSPSEIKEQLEKYADNIGLAFQIKDDILDVEGNTSIVGKTTGSDQKKSKSTFVSVLGMEKSKELLDMSINNALDSLKTLNNTDFLSNLAIWIGKREK